MLFLLQRFTFSLFLKILVMWASSFLFVIFFFSQNPRYVCVKMFGGGMGDQIKRCHSTKTFHSLRIQIDKRQRPTNFPLQISIIGWYKNSRYCEQLEPEDYILLQDMEVSNTYHSLLSAWRDWFWSIMHKKHKNIQGFKSFEESSAQIAVLP